MHLIYVGQNIVDIHELSTGVTVVLLLGALYGFIRLVVDIIKSFKEEPPLPRYWWRDKT